MTINLPVVDGFISKALYKIKTPKTTPKQQPPPPVAPPPTPKTKKQEMAEVFPKYRGKYNKPAPPDPAAIAKWKRFVDSGYLYNRDES